MAIRQIRTLGDPVLEKHCREVKEMTPRLQELIDDMLETMYQQDGVGLAAPQVGILRRIAVVDTGVPAVEEEETVQEQDGQDSQATQTGQAAPEGQAEQDAQAAPAKQESPYGDVKDYCEEPLILINPVIVETDGEQKGSEGCLSVPGKAGEVTRPEYVKVRAFDRDMKPYEVEGTGLLARALCHEIDHLDGIMYVTKVEGDMYEVKEEEE